MLDLRADKVELQRQIMILHARNERQQMLIEYLNGRDTASQLFSNVYIAAEAI